MDPKIVEIVSQLYRDVFIGDEHSSEMVLRGFLHDGIQFGIARVAYEHTYRDLFQALFTNLVIKDNWSEKAVTDAVHQLLSLLATEKLGSQSRDEDWIPQNLDEIVSNWMDQFTNQFEERQYCVPVKGLVIDHPIIVGKITFWPLETKQEELAKYEAFGFFDNLSGARDSIAGSLITAESQKAVEILKEDVEQALSVLRYLGALVWWDQPIRHIYMSGSEPERIWQAIEVIPNFGISKNLGQSNFTPLPFYINRETLPYFEAWGLDEVLNMTTKGDPSPLERILLNSIRWFGDAVQDLRPLSAFMKFYTSMESLVKQQSERAMTVVPDRISTLLESYDPENRARARELLVTLIRERNSIFHEGLPHIESPDYLVWASRNLARNSIHRMISLINDHHWRDRRDFIAWASAN